ncbi:MAG: diguanylate cyclase [Burkholderiaceae bacterium]|nr:diguanylate cyclase [Burkholderiaceae bacterium]
MDKARQQRTGGGRRPGWAAALQALALLLLGLPCRAGAEPLRYAVALSYHEDAPGRLDVSQVRALGESAWKTAKAEGASLGYTRSVVWFRLRIGLSGPAATAPVDSILEIGYPLLGDVQVHGLGPEPLQLGALRPFAQRPIPHRHFLVPLSVAPGRTLELLVRVRTESSLQFPVRVQERSQAEVADAGSLLMHGAYIGVVLAMLAYNLFMWVALRDQLYGWYLGWMLLIATFVLGMSGLAYQWWWPDSPRWNLVSLPLSLSLSLVFATEFFARFLQLARWSRTIRRISSVILLLNGLAALAALALPYSAAVQFSIACAMVTVLVCSAQAMVIARRGESAARLFLFNFSILLSGGVVMALSKVGILPHAPMTELAPQLGSGVELLLFSFALAMRVQSERRLREQAQREVIAQQTRLTGELERRVAERTLALEQANQELASLSRTDALTGLYNRRYLDERLGEEAARSRRSGRMLAVLMIDIDHFKRLNDTHGHAAGDVCLQAVAQRLKGATRQGQDLLARYGGEEFCLLAPVADSTCAQQLAERVRLAVAQAPVPWAGQSLALSVSVGLALGRGGDRDAVLALQRVADEALYAAKAAGRNCWRLALPDALPERAPPSAAGAGAAVLSPAAAG